MPNNSDTSKVHERDRNGCSDTEELPGSTAPKGISRRRFLRDTATLVLSTTMAYAVSGELFGETGVTPAAFAAGMPKRGGTIHAVVQPEPPGLMLGLVQNGPATMVAGNIYESLLRYNTKLEPQPSITKSWTMSDDAKVYTFKLYENVRWHDGKPFSADDVLFSVDFARKMNPRARANLSRVESVTAPDANTIVFTLKEPFGPFLGIFEVGSLPLIPKHIYAGTDYRTNPANNTPIGTGPFMFKEWQKGSYIRLVRNPHYYLEGKPYIDEIYWEVIPDAATRAVAYQSGKVDILPGGSIENFDVARLAKLKNTRVTTKGWELYSPLSFLWLNNRSGPTSHRKFREAIMYAMNRDFYKKVVWTGFGELAVGPIAPTTRFFNPRIKGYSYDPAKAKKLVKESGYRGEQVRLLPLPYGETWQRWAEAVRQNLRAVGVNVEMQATDVAGWNAKLAQWDYDIAFTYLYQFGDPALGVARSYISSQIIKGSPWDNVEGYSNPEVDKLFAEAAIAYPDSKRQALYNRIQKILLEDVPVAWLMELEFPTVYRSKIKNLITTAIGLSDGFRDAWIES